MMCCLDGCPHIDDLERELELLAEELGIYKAFADEVARILGKVEVESANATLSGNGKQEGDS
jgi:hypothetical protein